MTPQEQRHPFILTARSRAIVAVVGLVSAALGALVLIGWHAHLIALVQMRPTLAPMQYNAALCFLLAGVGMFAVSLGRIHFTQALAGVVIAISGLTLGEYLFRANFGIDQLFFHAYITTLTSHAGRMSPASALCLLQAGLALLLIGIRVGGKWRAPVVGSLGSIVIAIAVMAILGYAIGLPGTYGWGQWTRIALHTASGLCVLGIGLVVIAWSAGRQESERTPRWLPVPVGLSFFVASVVLWQALESEQIAQIAQTVKAGSESATDQIRVSIEGRMRSFVRMARRWEFSGRPSQAAWEDDAKAYVQHYPEIRALAWIDAAHLVRWVVPLEGNEATLGRDLIKEERRRHAVESAQRLRQPVITGTVTLYRGGLGYIVYVPIFVGTEFDGFVAAVFEAQSAFDRYLPPAVAAGDSIRLSEGGQTFYERSPGALPAHEEWIVDSRITLGGAVWGVRVSPTAASLAQLHSMLPLIALTIGLTSSLVLALTTFFAQRASAEAREIAAINRALVAAQVEIKTLSGLLPICAECKRIKDEEGHWNRMERYISKRTEVSFSHGVCPECSVKWLAREGIPVPEKIQEAFEEGKFDP